MRNLTAGEILSQVLIVNALHGGTGRAVTNIVLMGSGVVQLFCAELFFARGEYRVFEFGIA